MSQSMTTNFTSGRILPTSELNAGKLLAGPAAADSQPAALALEAGFSISGSTLNATNAGAVRLITTGIADTITATDGFVAWNSVTAGVKSERVGPGPADQIIMAKDAIGTAGAANGKL